MYLGFLTKLYRNIKSIGISKEYKLQIINIIFDIGVSAIESKDDDLIRICSNSLGWHAKDLFDADSYESFKSCINSASNLYKLLVELKYDESLIIFIGTLFVVLGAYLNTKDDKYANNFIISETSKLPEKDLLKYSKKLRQFGSSFWDQELEMNSAKEMQKFIDKVLK